jgi:hypothetical protein
MREADLRVLAEVDLASGHLVRALTEVAGEEAVAAAVRIVRERLGLDRWDEDEPREPSEPSDRRPAVYYAPRGACEYCDRRREAAARSMRRARERGER